VELYRVLGLPACFVVADDAGQLWIVPDIPDGWRLRSRYRIDPLLARILRPVPQSAALGVGIPPGSGPIRVERVDADELPPPRLRPNHNAPSRRVVRRLASLRA